MDTKELARKRAEEKYKDMCWTSEEEKRQDLSMKIHAEAEEPLLELLKEVHKQMTELRSRIEHDGCIYTAQAVEEKEILEMDDLLDKINTILQP